LSVLLASFVFGGSAFAAAPKPNVIFILADDLGYGELGCYGQKLMQTPVLGRMAAFRPLRREMESRPDGGRAALVVLCDATANDPSPAVRREVALAPRDMPFAQSQNALLVLAKTYDGRDRWMLEAIDHFEPNEHRAFVPSS
jgi:hypothetical protein